MSDYFGKSWQHWIDEYAQSHRHPANRLCHKIGIPMIIGSLPLLIVGVWSSGTLNIGIWLFAAGWALQFLGHAFEGKPPEFIKDWRFLLVGARWWLGSIKRDK